ncbi:hypothetical protein DPMN_137911 [Dreissena polymorpha]|uniref:Uncharacterized protein n=1 Tax=Dreissena polymorpha TaxID=45954 RepID=A0A9D4JI35_DREPO|nr:hypothetical protein DPMN_137911 [Dreissena polymorpha]
MVCSTKKNSIVHLSVDGDILGTYLVNMKYPYNICVSKNCNRLAVYNGAAGTPKLQLYLISPAIS